MSASRARSCQPCRLAKTRCSLEVPCSRCSKRGLECHYALGKANTRTGGLREIRPAPGVLSQTQSDDYVRVTTDETSYYGPITVDFDPDSTVPKVHTYDMLPEVDTSRPVTATFQPERRANRNMLPYSCTLRSTAPAVRLSLPPSRDNGTWREETPPCTESPPTPTLNPSHMALRSVPLGPQLIQRGRSLQQGSLTAKMLLSRLGDFARTMADCKELPPFIHPPCISQEGRTCLAGSSHCCLDPILSQCAGLARSFHQTKSRYVWQRIIDHLRELLSDYETYDEHTMLQAMQATVLYSLVCSQCSTTSSFDCSSLAVTCIEKLGKRLFSMIPWNFSAEITATLPWSQWILVESIRRLACVLYLIDLLLLTDADTPSRGNCDTFWDMPLPCYRELWSATSEDWRGLLEDRPRKGDITLGKLLILRQSKRLDEVVAKSGGSAIAEELAEWCERADDLSMLLWMALTVEGEGQSKHPEMVPSVS